MTASASLRVDGTNFKIRSEPLHVPNMEATVEELSRYIARHGGTCRRYSTSRREQRKGFEPGYYNSLSIEFEGFVYGVIFSLAGQTPLEPGYCVNPSRQSLQLAIRRPEGVSLGEIDEFVDYEHLLRVGLVERQPRKDGPGILRLELEGPLASSPANGWNLYHVTGLRPRWPIPLRLTSPA